MTERTYVPVPDAAVDPDLRRRAAIGAGIAATRLGIPVPAITWIVLAPDGVHGLTPGHHFARNGRELAGLSRMDSPDRIWIRADLPDAMQTAIHEVRHLWQFGRIDDYPDPEQREIDAETWAIELMSAPLTLEEIAWTR